MFRYFVYFAYDGANYHGWQIQPNGISVQEELQKVLTTFFRQPIEVVGAGRTDAGVHASRMVAHFEVPDLLDCVRLTDKMNRMLPPDIAVHEIRRVRAEAHARFDATYRKYQYHITMRKDPFHRNYAWRIFQQLDFDAMNKAAEVLFEFIDFTSFSKLHTDVKTNNCKIMHARWKQEGPQEWVFTIQADRFLRNMVRAIVGTLIEVGRGKLSVDGFRDIINRKNRCAAGTSAPGHALFLVDVGYPEDIFVAE